MLGKKKDAAKNESGSPPQAGNAVEKNGALKKVLIAIAVIWALSVALAMLNARFGWWPTAPSL